MSQSILLENVKIIDVLTGGEHGPVDILTSDSKIREIRADVEISTLSVKEVDCTGKFVLPGFFDAHTHLTTLTRQPPEVQREIFDECQIDEPFQEDKLAESVLSDFVSRGITQVRDLGGPIVVLKGIKETINEAKMAGPDVLYAGPMLEMPPLTGAEINERWPGWKVPVESQDETREVMESLVRDKVSCLKVFGNFEAGILKSLVENASRLNLPVTCDPGHTFFHDIDIKNGLDAGIRCFEHAKSLWYSVLKDELKNEHDSLKQAMPETRNSFIQRMLNLGPESISVSKLDALAELLSTTDTVICPTLNIFKFYSEKSEVCNDREPEKVRSVFQALYEVGCCVVSKLAENGIRMLVGQDGYIPRFTHREMELLGQNGVSALEILKGATCYPAEWLRITDWYGSVSVGKKANLVILNRSPIDNITFSQDIFAVLKDGEIFPV